MFIHLGLALPRFQLMSSRFSGWPVSHTLRQAPTNAAQTSSGTTSDRLGSALTRRRPNTDAAVELAVTTVRF